MDAGGSRAHVAFVGVAIALGLLVVVGTAGVDSGGLEAKEEQVAGPAERTEVELTEAELHFAEDFVEPESRDTTGYSNCASLIGCIDWNGPDWTRWVEEQIAAGEDPFPQPEPASNCVGFCFNATIDSVNEDNWRLARVVMVGKKGERTPAVVERTSILSSSRRPAAEGKPVRFACYDRFRGEDGLRFESCSQMAVE
jgi:hypothetical protein